MTTLHDDFIERSADICWPDGFDPANADLFAHNAVVVDASANSVWAKLIAAAAWPTWYSNASDVVINDPSGQLGEGVTFNWTTFGLKIASKVAEFAPYARLSWYGSGAQLRAYHTWLLIPRSGGQHLCRHGRNRHGPRGTTPRHNQSRSPAPRSRFVEHQPQVRVRGLSERADGALLDRILAR